MPRFAMLFVGLLVCDLAVIYQIGVSRDEALWAVLIQVLLFLLPLAATHGGPEALRWYQADSGRSSAQVLLDLTCASNLVFLVVASLLHVLPVYDNLALFMLVFFCLIHFFRLFLAAHVQVILALILAILCKNSRDRLSALASATAAGAGIALYHSQLLQVPDSLWPRLQSDAGGLYVSLFVFGILSLLYSLHCGGFLHWLLLRRKRTQASLPT